MGRGAIRLLLGWSRDFVITNGVLVHRLGVPLSSLPGVGMLAARPKMLMIASICVLRDLCSCGGYPYHASGRRLGL